MKEMVILNRKEQRRLMILNEVEKGQIAGKEASKLLGLSLRHERRLLAAYRKEGALALAHGNRGRKPNHALDDILKRKVLELAQSAYLGCNNQHFADLLAEREGINLSCSSVRRILLEAGIKSPRKRRPPRHRRRRERYSKEGMLLQIDGSRHDWLEGRGPYLSLIGAIDDATGKVPYALFREQEDAQGYFILLERITGLYGLPMALYHDRHGIFYRSRNDHESLQEQLEGERRPTQFGRLMEELGIISIPSYSPQARGRIERLWGTFQDRLVSELRLKGAKTMEEANQVLWDYLPGHNEKFATVAAEPDLAYRKPEGGFIPDEVFCFKYRRTVGLDNVVRFGEHRLQIMPTNGRMSYARAKVEVHERMDGSIGVYYQGQCLATKPAPLEAPMLRVRNMATVTPKGANSEEFGVPVIISRDVPQPRSVKPRKPGPDHPWRKPLVMHTNRG